MALERRDSLRRQFDLLDGRLLLEWIVRVRLQSLHVIDDLAVELVDQHINRGVQIAVRAFDEYTLAFQMQIDFRSLLLVFLLVVFDREDHSSIDNLVAMPQYPIQLGDYVFANRRGDFEMVSTDLQVHSASPS